MNKVVLSYARADSETADQIAAGIADAGVEITRNIKRIQRSHVLNDATRELWDEALAVVIILSADSLQSHWVSYEFGYAAGRGVRLLPYLVDAVLEPPGFIEGLRCATQASDVKQFITAHEDWVRQTEPVAEPEPEPDQIDDSLDAAFALMTEMMADLLGAMREDLELRNPLIREFVPLEQGVTANHGKPRFEYREEQIPHLFRKLDMLRANGFVTERPAGKYTRVYTMSEALVNRLRTWQPRQGQQRNQQAVAS